MEQADILVAGDESVATRSLAGMIARLGHRVVGMAASGEEALCRVMEHSPDIVVMDIEAMVLHEAIEAATYIHQIFNTPVVFVAGAADDVQRHHARMILDDIARWRAGEPLRHAVVQPKGDEP